MNIDFEFGSGAGGRVGSGIYLADALEKSNSYVRHHRRADGTQLGMVFLVEAALGTMAEITRDDGSLVKAPNGFHSVLAKGTVAPDMYDSLIRMHNCHKTSTLNL